MIHAFEPPAQQKQRFDTCSCKLVGPFRIAGLLRSIFKFETQFFNSMLDVFCVKFELDPRKENKQIKKWAESIYSMVYSLHLSDAPHTLRAFVTRRKRAKARARAIAD